MTCRWDRQLKRHLTREHRDDCTSNLCPGCQACLDIYQQPGENRDDREELPDA